MLDVLPEADRATIAAAATRRRYDAGQVVFHAGDAADSVHLIRRGHVTVRRSTRFGDVVTLSVLGPGDLFGELGAIQADGVRAATVVAIDPTETLRWDRAQFDQLRSRYPAVEAALVHVLTGQVSRITAHLMEALFESADTRIVRRLLAICELYGGPAAGTVVPLTQEDLAAMAGTTRPTVNRTLRAMVADGAIEVARGRITIVAPEMLARRAR
jgi:CRP/FNR family transcriptional regulator, cyclic AMP receptor protein